MNQRTCETCSSDIEAVVVRGPGTELLVDAAPVIPATDMGGLLLRRDPAGPLVERIPSGEGQAIYTEHRCDLSLVLHTVEVPARAVIVQ